MLFLLLDSSLTISSSFCIMKSLFVFRLSSSMYLCLASAGILILSSSSSMSMLISSLPRFSGVNCSTYSSPHFVLLFSLFGLLRIRRGRSLVELFDFLLSPTYTSFRCVLLSSLRSIYSL